MPSLSDQALQMESLIKTLLPHKRSEIEKWTRIRDKEIENLEEWYDNHIKSLEEELSILLEHAAALGLEPETATSDHEKRKQELETNYSNNLLTPEERQRAIELLGLPSQTPSGD